MKLYTTFKDINNKKIFVDDEVLVIFSNQKEKQGVIKFYDGCCFLCLEDEINGIAMYGLEMNNIKLKLKG